MSITTYYDTLGVSRKASLDEIKSQYRVLAKQYHPDVNPKAADLFREIQEAYEVLSDSTKRANYDHMIKKAEEEALRKQTSSTTNTTKPNKGRQLTEAQEKFLASAVDTLYVALKTEFEPKERKEYQKLISKAYRNRDVEEINRLTVLINDKLEKIIAKQDNNTRFESDLYYTDPYMESIFTIIYNWCEYRFENAFAGVWNRNPVAILGALFVYTLAVPLTAINKILFFLKPKHKKCFAWHWITHLHYLLYKDSLIGTTFWTCLLVFMLVTRTIFTILYIAYWLFKNVIRYFLLPIAIIAAAIIRTFGRAMVVNTRHF